jgi:hypothetical protein
MKIKDKSKKVKRIANNEKRITKVLKQNNEPKIYKYGTGLWYK